MVFLENIGLNGTPDLSQRFLLNPSVNLRRNDLVASYAKKSKTIKKKMNGLKSGRPADLRRMSYRFRRVARPYGGVLTHEDVKMRIMRAFMTEELQSIKQKQQAAEKKSKKSKKGAKKAKK